MRTIDVINSPVIYFYPAPQPPPIRILMLAGLAFSFLSAALYIRLSSKPQDKQSPTLRKFTQVSFAAAFLSNLGAVALSTLNNPYNR